MPDYSQGKVYKIVNSVTDVIYIGSTCQKLSARMGEHRYEARNEKETALYCAMRKLGVDRFKIILIEDFPCKNVTQLVAREYEHMVKAKSERTELYNHVIDGQADDATRQKMSGENNHGFKRGSVRFSASKNQWSFAWNENGHRNKRSWNVNKYGAAEARAFALKLQDEFYPKINNNEDN